MIGPFQFEDGGRTYTCTIEKRTTAPVGTWWWFALSDERQRYAPFETAEKDTQKSVRERIIAFYNHRLERLAAPVEPRRHWGGRPKSVPASAAADADLGDE